MIGKPPVAPTPEIASEMRAKHPAARLDIDWACLRPLSAAAAATFDDELVRKAVMSFPKDSGGGPSGLRPQHLKDALVPGFEDELLRQLSALTNLMARGEAAQDARSAMCGASLAALPKEEGDHRPIAVGEVLRRVVGKTLAEASKEDARSLLEPFQVGVGTGGGCEAVVHVVRKWLGIHVSDRRRVLAKIDLESAFNTLDRQ